MPVTYEVICHRYRSLFTNLAQLSGEIVGPSGHDWKDSARAAAHNARKLAAELDRAASGDCESFMAFPSAADVAADTAGYAI